MIPLTIIFLDIEAFSSLKLSNENNDSWFVYCIKFKACILHLIHRIINGYECWLWDREKKSKYA